MRIILPSEILDYIFEFINFNNITNRLKSINEDKIEIYMFFIKNNMNYYYDSNGRRQHTLDRMKILEEEKQKIFKKCCTRLLIFNKFVQCCKMYYVKGNNGLILSKEDKEVFTPLHI